MNGSVYSTTQSREGEEEEEVFTSSDPKEHPRVNSQTESKRQTNVQQNARVRRLCQASLGPSVGTGSGCIGDLRSSKGEEQEQKGADEFAEEGDEVVTGFVREETQAWEAEAFAWSVGSRFARLLAR